MKSLPSTADLTCRKATFTAQAVHALLPSDSSYLEPPQPRASPAVALSESEQQCENIPMAAVAQRSPEVSRSALSSELLAPSLLKSKLQHLASSPESPRSLLRGLQQKGEPEVPAAMAPPSTPRAAPSPCVPRLQLTKCMLGGCTPMLAGLSPASLQAVSAGATPSTAPTHRHSTARTSLLTGQATSRTEVCCEQLTVRSMATPPATQRPAASDSSPSVPLALPPFYTPSKCASVLPERPQVVAEPKPLVPATDGNMAGMPPPPPVAVSARQASAGHTLGPRAAAQARSATSARSGSLFGSQPKMSLCFSVPAPADVARSSPNSPSTATYLSPAHLGTGSKSARHRVSSKPSIVCRRRTDPADSTHGISPRPSPLKSTISSPAQLTGAVDHPCFGSPPMEGTFTSSAHKRKASVSDLASLAHAHETGTVRALQFHRDSSDTALPILPTACVPRVSDASPTTRRGGADDAAATCSLEREAAVRRASHVQLEGRRFSETAVHSIPSGTGLRQAQIDGASIGQERNDHVHMEDLVNLNDKLQEVSNCCFECCVQRHLAPIAGKFR
jgi:hypothetical protein